MVDWYLAPSLAVLRAEIDARWPRRDHTSDGTIGDADHQASKSDHNPNARGSVNAIDVDEDGVDFAAIFAAIKRHPSARYVIYEQRLYHRLRGWVSEPYAGVNPHDHHFHLSIDQTAEAEQDRRSWGLLEDEMLTAQQAKQLRATDARAAALVAMKPSHKTVWSDANPDGTEQVLLVQHLLGLEAAVKAIASRVDIDPVELAAIQAAAAEGAMAGATQALSPEALADAIPDDIAQAVVDLLVARLQS